MFIAVCEDNRIEITEVVRALEKISYISQIICFNEAQKLIDALKDKKFDIIFLDIAMPHMNGLEAAKIIRKLDPEVHIVFVTALDRYMQDAFSVYATDYILKPINHERFERTVNRIYDKITGKDSKLIEIKTQNIVYRVKESDIILLEKVMNRCIVYTEKFTFDVLSPLKYFEDVLDKDKFVRSHAGYLVNMDKITQIDVNGNLSYTLHFYNIEKTALVSRGKKNKLFEHFSNNKKVLAGG